jgi:tetratricopeptide (TPR) repeat protein
MNTRLVVILVLMGCCGIGLIGFGLVMTLRNVAIQRRAAAPLPAPAARPPAAPGQPLPKGPETFEQLLAEYARVIQQADAPGDDLWNLRRLAEEVDRDGALRRHNMAVTDPATAQHLRGWVTRKVANHREVRPYRAATVKSVEWLVPGKEAVLTVRATGDIGGESHVWRDRWWVVQENGWRFFDYFDPLDPRKYSDEVRRTHWAGERSDREVRDEDRACRAYERGVAAVRDGDFEAAERLFNDPVLEHLPDGWKRTLPHERIIVARGLGKPNDIRAELALAERSFPDTAALADVQLEGYYDLRDYKQVLAAADRYVRLLGRDDRVCLYRAHALAALGRGAEAVADYRSVLDDDPDSATALVGLARSLPAGDRAEVEARYAKFANPAAAFDEVVADFRNDPDVIARLVRVVRRNTPDHPGAYYEEARMRSRDAGWETAVPLYLKAVEHGGERRENYLDRFLSDALTAGRAVEAYNRVPDPLAGSAFGILFVELDDLDAEEPAVRQVFEAVVAAHRRRRPSDPRLLIADGIVQNLNKQYDAADASFAAGLAKPEVDEDEKTGWRFRRIDNLVEAGRPMVAYERVGPRRETFRRLAGRLAYEKNPGPLEELVAVHTRAEPDDLELPRWVGEVHFRKGEYEPAVNQIRKYLARQDPDKPSYDYGARDALVRSLLRLKRFDEAAKALRPDEAVKYYNRVLEAAIVAAKGDVAQTEKLLAAMVADGQGRAEWFHADEDLSAALKTPPFQKVLEKYPVPKPAPAPKK